MNTQLETIQFTNRPPLRMDPDKIRCIHTYHQEWGHKKIVGYKGESRVFIWESSNSGMFYGSQSPTTNRTMIKSGKASEVAEWAKSLKPSNEDYDCDCDGVTWSQSAIDDVMEWLGVEPEIA